MAKSNTPKRTATKKTPGSAAKQAAAPAPMIVEAAPAVSAQPIASAAPLAQSTTVLGSPRLTLTRPIEVSAETKDVKAPEASAARVAGLSDELIARRAYDIWMSRGCPAGQELENWLEAERQLAKA